MLLPFVRVVIGCLLVVTLSAFAAGVAKIHMAILSFLSFGLLVSLSLFEKEWDKVQNNREESSSSAPPSTGKPEKTD